MSKKGHIKEITLAPREWERLVNKGVGRSFLKTITEPVTNCDTSYKRFLGIPMATGIVDLILSVDKGKILDSSVWRKKLINKQLRREIKIEISTTKRHKKIKHRQCRIIDNAEGMDEKILDGLYDYGGDKTELSKGKPGRSLFGRGLSDVLLFHDNGAIHSVVGDKIFSAEGFSPDGSSGKLQYKVTEVGTATKKNRGIYNLPPEGNGTCVEFVVNEACSIPGKDRFKSLLSNYYMLRLINIDPNTEICITRYDGPLKKEKYSLEYDFPIGQVIGKISKKMSFDSLDKTYDLDIQGTVIRSDRKLLGINGDIDSRENGLLIVDDNDAVLHQTLLPDFDKSPYLQKIFGIIRIAGLRQLLFDHLEAGKKAIDILTVSRDGFDERTKFTQKLYEVLEKELKPIYEREKKLYEDKQAGGHNSEIQNKTKDALKTLNKFFHDQTDEAGDEPDPDPKLSFQFIPPKTFLRAKREKNVKLIMKSDAVVDDEVILIESDNENVGVRPDSVIINKKQNDKNGELTYKVYLLCDELHERANISAITPSANDSADLTANIEIIDVKGYPVVDPPEEMEFRPNKSVGSPNKRSSIMLYINLEEIPEGRQLRFNLSDARGSLALLDGEKKTDNLKISISKAHIIESGSIAKIPIYFIGTGKGQHANIHASATLKDGKLVYATGKIEIGEVQSEGDGFFERAEYVELDQKVAGTVSERTIYINSKHPVNKRIFGKSKKNFDEKVMDDMDAQLRYAELLLDIVVFYTAQIKESKGGEQGFVLRPNMYVQDIQGLVDRNKYELAPKVYKAIVTGF